MEDGVKLLLSLRSNVVVQILISVRDILAQVHFTGVNNPGEHTIPVVGDDISMFVSFHHRKEEHILDIGGCHDTPTLAGWSHRSDPDFVTSLLS